jgi:hypothetical protein
MRDERKGGQGEWREEENQQRMNGGNAEGVRAKRKVRTVDGREERLLVTVHTSLVLSNKPRRLTVSANSRDASEGLLERREDGGLRCRIEPLELP